MSDEKNNWKPDDDEALKALVRETIKAAGLTDSRNIPHKVKERIRGQATGELDIDAIIKQVLEETKKED